MSTGRRATIVVDYSLGEIRVYLVEPTQAAQFWEWYEAATVGSARFPMSRIGGADCGKCE